MGAETGGHVFSVGYQHANTIFLCAGIDSIQKSHIPAFLSMSRFIGSGHCDVTIGKAPQGGNWDQANLIIAEARSYRLLDDG